MANLIQRIRGWNLLQSLYGQINQLFVDNGDGTHSLAVNIQNAVEMGGGVDKETPHQVFKCNSAFTGASIGDVIVGILTLDTTTNTLVSDTPVWYNYTTGQTITVADHTKLTAVAANALTAAELAIYIGNTNETAPANDTDASGLNGRLQRITQRLTSLIALFPASLGAKASSGSLSITPATDADFPIEFHNHHLSAFGDFVTVPMQQVIDMDFVNGLDDTCMVATSGTTGAGVTVANNQAVISSGTSSTGYAVLFSDKPTRYRARIGVRAAFTCIFDTPIANCMQLKGVANFALSAPQTILDGYFFGYYVGTDSTSTAYDGTTFGILHRNSASGSVVDRFYPATQWIDAMDGNGESGVNWDKTKGMTVEIDYPYQGYGCIFFKATNPTTGEYIDILIIPYPNSATVPQLSNPNLRYWDGVINSGNTISKSTKTGSVGTFLCGEKRYTARHFPMKSSKSVTNGNALCLLAIQIPATFNANAVRGLARLATLTAFSGGNSYGFVDVLLNPTITGAVWAVNDATLTVPTGGTVSLSGASGSYTVNGSAGTFAINPFIVDTTGTTVTGGRLIDSVALGTNTNIEVDYDASANREMPVFHPGDIVAFIAQPQANGNMGVTVKMLNEL